MGGQVSGSAIFLGVALRPRPHAILSFFWCLFPDHPDPFCLYLHETDPNGARCSRSGLILQRFAGTKGRGRGHEQAKKEGDNWGRGHGGAHKKYKCTVCCRGGYARAGEKVRAYRDKRGARGRRVSLRKELPNYAQVF
jgi:hypothetical protein